MSALISSLAYSGQIGSGQPTTSTINSNMTAPGFGTHLQIATAAVGGATASNALRNVNDSGAVSATKTPIDGAPTKPMQPPSPPRMTSTAADGAKGSVGTHASTGRSGTQAADAVTTQPMPGVAPDAKAGQVVGLDKDTDTTTAQGEPALAVPVDGDAQALPDGVADDRPGGAPTAKPGTTARTAAAVHRSAARPDTAGDDDVSAAADDKGPDSLQPSMQLAEPVPMQASSRHDLRQNNTASDRDVASQKHAVARTEHSEKTETAAAPSPQEQATGTRQDFSDTLSGTLMDHTVSPDATALANSLSAGVERVAPAPVASVEPSGSSNATRSGDASTPATQIEAPLVSLASLPNGSNQMTVSMHPKDLGEVRIRLDRKIDGSVNITVSANEPSTLRSLMSEQAHLHAALDAAAVPGTDRQLNFELAGQDNLTSGTSGNAGQTGTDSQNSGYSGGQDSPRDTRSYPRHPGTDDGADDNLNPVRPDQIWRASGYFRAGINVTA